MPDLQGMIGAQGSSLDEQSRAATARQTALDKEQQSTLARQDAQMRPAEAALTSALDAPVPARPQVAMPEPPKQVPVNPKEYEGLSYALLGIGLIAGARSNKNWMGASATLNGAMKGYIDGKHEEADAAMKDYDRQFRAAKDHEEQVNRQFDDVLNNRKLSINEQLERIKVLAAQHGREDVRMAAQQRSIDAVVRQIDAGRTQLAGVQQRSDAVTQRLTAARERASVAGAGNKNGPKTEGGLNLEAAILEAGGNVSNFGGKGPVYDRIMERELAKGRSPEDVAQDILKGKIDISSATSASRTATIREQAVERLTGSLKEVEGEVTRLAKAAGNSGVPASNATMNWVKRNMGDGTLQELQLLMGTVGRQYQEAVTMPGSNAQMHATAQEWADRNFHENMSLEQIAGAIRGMNFEIAATKRNLESQVRSSTDAVGGRTDTAPHAPYPDAEKERRYQEWKASHAGAQ